MHFNRSRGQDLEIAELASHNPLFNNSTNNVTQDAVTTSNPYNKLSKWTKRKVAVLVFSSLGIVAATVAAIVVSSQSGSNNLDSNPNNNVALNERDSITSPTVFNWRFYLHNYPDLCANAETRSEQGAKNHWIAAGLAEGRQGHPNFSASQYLAEYEDLKNAFGATGFQKALKHYLNNGIKEGRKPIAANVANRPASNCAAIGEWVELGWENSDWLVSSTVFDWRFYIENHSDLCNAFPAPITRNVAASHWLSNGIAEGRRAHPNFHMTEYKALHGDIASFSNSAAVEHFARFGFIENRKAANAVVNPAAACGKLDEPGKLGATPGGVSVGYRPPLGKQGVTDVYYSQPANIQRQRYSNLARAGLGIKIYNLYWSQFENSPVESSSTPVTCPNGYELVPANEQQRVALGYHRFRCFRLAEKEQFLKMMQLDKLIGIQSAAALWSAPPRYRYAGCVGFPWAGVPGNRLFDGCVPRDDAMSDFEDWVNFVSVTFGRNLGNQLKHYIIWNENASGGWFDYSPVVPSRPGGGQTSLTEAQKTQWVAKYADMMLRSHVAVKRHQTGVLIHASTDHIWEKSSSTVGEKYHLGTKYFLNKLWDQLGTTIDWSVATHPYDHGKPEQNLLPNAYTFATLEVVYNLQKAQLQKRGIQNALATPQGLQVASEQGWVRGDNGNLFFEIGQNICKSHDLAVKDPFVLGVTHNYFQQLGLGLQNGAQFGLLPAQVGDTLNHGAGVSTWEAYIGTGSYKWGRSSKHFCCVHSGVGCA